MYDLMFRKFVAFGLAVSSFVPGNLPEAWAIENVKSQGLNDVLGETEHLPPASATLIDQVLEEIPPESTDSFLRKPNDRFPTTASLDDLRSFSLTLDRQGKDIQNVPKENIIFIDTIGPRPKRILKYYPVTRPGESNFVAVILTVSHYPSILNPIEGFNYGPIPFLPRLTLEQANALWGPPVEEKTLFPGPGSYESRSYKLTSKDQKGEMKLFSLNCFFRKGHLFNYEISFPGTDWVSSGPMYCRHFVNP